VTNFHRSSQLASSMHATIALCQLPGQSAGRQELAVLYH
jgi:hypothetical protein